MQELIDRLSRGLEHHHDEIAVAYLFGSAARGRRSTLSDIDVGILLAQEPPNRLRYRARLSEELSRCAGGTVVQVILLDEASPALAARAIRDRRVILCRDEDRRKRFEIDVIRRDLDTVYLRRLHERIQQRAITEGRFYG